MNRRSFIIMLGTAPLASSALVACGRDENGTGDGQGENGSTTAPVAEGPATGTINVWAMGTEGEALGEFAKAFQDENPEATVKVTPVPWDAAHERISTAIAAKKTPDVSLIGTTWMGEFGAGGGLDPTPTELFSKDAFFPGAWDSTVVEGVSYGVPWYVETRVLFYRTDLAEQAGVSDAPATWDDLKNLAIAYRENGAKWGMQLPPGGTGSWQTFLPFAWQQGAEIYSDGAFTFDSPELTEAMEYYNSFFTDGLASTEALEPGALESGFVDGSIPMFISGPWHVGLLNDQGGEGFADQYTVVALPTDGEPASFAGGGDLAVFADTENRDGAWKFVQWLTDPETQQNFYATVSDLPSVQEAWQSGDLADDPVLEVFGEQLESAIAPPAVPTWEQVAAELDSELEEVAKGGKDIGEAAAAVQQKADSIGTGL